MDRVLRHSSAPALAGAYEIDWDEESDQYVPVDVPLETTLVLQLNDVLETVEALEPKQGYHDFEDKILSSMTARYPLFKIGKLWLGEDYATMLEYRGWQQQHQILLLPPAARLIRSKPLMLASRPLWVADSTGRCNTLELREQKECVNAEKTKDPLHRHAESVDVGALEEG